MLSNCFCVAIVSLVLNSRAVLALVLIVFVPILCPLKSRQTKARRTSGWCVPSRSQQPKDEMVKHSNHCWLVNRLHDSGWAIA